MNKGLTPAPKRELVRAGTVRCRDSRLVRGLTLIEVLLYAVILTVILGIFTGILTISTKVQVVNNSNAEVSSQLNFTMQTIQRLVRESSAIIVKDQICEDYIHNPSYPQDSDDTGQNLRCLKLRMPTLANDPTYIWAGDPNCPDFIPTNPLPCANNPPASYFTGNGVVKIKEGNNSTVITTLKTTCLVNDAPGGGGENCLTFQKYKSYPGRDLVTVGLTLGGGNGVTRSISANISRVSAASFDYDLLPQSVGINIGSDALPWRDLYLDGIIKQPNNYNGGDRGFMMVANLVNSCTNVCASHGNICAAVALILGGNGSPVPQSYNSPEACNYIPPLASGLAGAVTCFCTAVP